MTAGPQTVAESLNDVLVDCRMGGGKDGARWHGALHAFSVFNTIIIAVRHAGLRQYSSSAKRPHGKYGAAKDVALMIYAIL